MSWTTDNGKGFPQSNTEWASLYASTVDITDAPLPDSIYLQQEASGSLADSGTANLALTAAGTVAYRQAVTGFTTKSVKFTDNTAGSFVSTSASLPDLRTQSMAVLQYGIVNAAPAASRDIMEFGGATEFRARITQAPRLVVVDGANTATGAADPTGVVRPFMDVINLTSSNATLYSDADKLTPTFAAGTSSGRLFRIGGSSGGNNPPSFNSLYTVRWDKTNAEYWTAFKVRRLLEALGWSPTFAVTDTQIATAASASSGSATVIDTDVAPGASTSSGSATAIDTDVATGASASSGSATAIDTDTATGASGSSGSATDIDADVAAGTGASSGGAAVVATVDAAGTSASSGSATGSATGAATAAGIWSAVADSDAEFTGLAIEEPLGDFFVGGPPVDIGLVYSWPKPASPRTSKIATASMASIAGSSFVAAGSGHAIARAGAVGFAITGLEGASVAVAKLSSEAMADASPEFVATSEGGWTMAAKGTSNLTGETLYDDDEIERRVEERLRAVTIGVQLRVRRSGPRSAEYLTRSYNRDPSNGHGAEAQRDPDAPDAGAGYTR